MSFTMKPSIDFAFSRKCHCKGHLIMSSRYSPVTGEWSAPRRRVPSMLAHVGEEVQAAGHFDARSHVRFVYVPRLLRQHCDKNTSDYHDYLAAYHHLSSFTWRDANRSRIFRMMAPRDFSSRCRTRYMLPRKSLVHLAARTMRRSHDAPMMRMSRASSRDDYIAVYSSLRDARRVLQKITPFTQCMSEPHKDMDRHVISRAADHFIVGNMKLRRSTEIR